MMIDVGTNHFGGENHGNTIQRNGIQARDKLNSKSKRRYSLLNAVFYASPSQNLPSMFELIKTQSQIYLVMCTSKTPKMWLLNTGITEQPVARRNITSVR